MKQLLALGLTFLFITIIGCSKDSTTGPEVPIETGISIVSISPLSPSTLKYYKTGNNDRITITFNYTVLEPDGVRIWIEPVNNSDEGSIYYSPSPVYTGSGIKTVVASVSSDKDTLYMSQLRVKIKTPDQSSTISESYLNVNYTFTK